MGLDKATLNGTVAETDALGSERRSDLSAGVGLYDERLGGLRFWMFVAFRRIEVALIRDHDMGDV